jgi:hypothetical protein
MANAHRPTLPPSIGSTLGAAAFHDLVRDGSAWDHRAPDTRLPLLHLTQSPGLLRVVSFWFLSSSTRPLRSRADARRPTSPWRIGLVSSTPRRASTAGQYFWSSPRRLSGRSPWRAHLAACFPLRCFQRFSLPDVATQPCGTPHNWCTSGLSKPVLSY